MFAYSQHGISTWKIGSGHGLISIWIVLLISSIGVFQASCRLRLKFTRIKRVRELEKHDFDFQFPLTQPNIEASDGIARQGARRDARMSPRDKDIPLDEPIAGEKRRNPEGQVMGTVRFAPSLALTLRALIAPKSVPDRFVCWLLIFSVKDK